MWLLLWFRRAAVYFIRNHMYFIEVYTIQRWILRKSYLTKLSHTSDRILYKVATFNSPRELLFRCSFDGLLYTKLVYYDWRDHLCCKLIQKPQNPGSWIFECLHVCQFWGFLLHVLYMTTCLSWNFPSLFMQCYRCSVCSCNVIDA